MKAINHLKRFIKKYIINEGGKPSYMISEKSISLLQEEASKIVNIFFNEIKYGSDKIDAIKVVNEFFNLYYKRPIKVNIGGSGFENLFWLYISARIINPKLIVESGIWAGQSTWILRAACPDAEFHAFDIDLSNRKYINNTVNYHEKDWANHQFNNDNINNSLCFFDDHISHGKRIIEAKERGFKNLIFDDNLPVYMLFRETDTIAPTIDMIFDDNLCSGDVIEWLKNGKKYSHKINSKENKKIRDSIKFYKNFPLIDYSAETAATKARLGGNSKTAFVQID